MQTVRYQITDLEILHTISKNPSIYDYNDIAQGQTTILTEFLRVLIPEIKYKEKKTKRKAIATPQTSGTRGYQFGYGPDSSISTDFQLDI